MSELIAIVYDSKHGAEEHRLQLLKMERDHLIDLEDAVVVRKTNSGRVKLNQTHELTLSGAAGGGFWGLLVGALFLNPVLGFVAGATAGAITGALRDIGISDKWMEELGDAIRPGNSALFILIRNASPDEVLNDLQGFGGTILQTNLTSQDEQALQAALRQENKNNKIFHRD